MRNDATVSKLQSLRFPTSQVLQQLHLLVICSKIAELPEMDQVGSSLIQKLVATILPSSSDFTSSGDELSCAMRACKWVGQQYKTQNFIDSLSTKQTNSSECHLFQRQFRDFPIHSNTLSILQPDRTAASAPGLGSFFWIASLNKCQANWFKKQPLLRFFHFCLTNSLKTVEFVFFLHDILWSKKKKDPPAKISNTFSRKLWIWISILV